MESQSDPSSHSKKALRRNSNSHISISDTDSPVSQGDRYFSPLPSPGKSGSGESSPVARVLGLRPWPASEMPTSRKGDAMAGNNQVGLENHGLGVKSGSTVVLGVNKLVREEPAPGVKKLEHVGGGGGRLEERHGFGRDEELGRVDAILRRSERGVSLRSAALTFRILASVICLISFSVMATDKTRGWSGDSFDRYIEYRFCLAVNVIGFAYSAFQAFDLGSRLGGGKHHRRSRHCFDFTMDQLLAYLLASASSSAATRVNDWILNWGRDDFTTMAAASIAMSFLAFIAFALSSLISGYNLCNFDSA